MSSNSACNHTRDKQRFCYHSYDYRLNWTPLSPITITYYYCYYYYYYYYYYYWYYYYNWRATGEVFVCVVLFYLRCSCLFTLCFLFAMCFCVLLFLLRCAFFFISVVLYLRMSSASKFMYGFLSFGCWCAFLFVLAHCTDRGWSKFFRKIIGSETVSWLLDLPLDSLYTCLVWQWISSHLNTAIPRYKFSFFCP